MLRSMWRGDQAIRFKPKFSTRQWKWVASFLRQCTTEAADRNTRVKSALCEYSRDVLQEVVAETGVEYHQNKGGIVYFYRTEKAFEAARKKSRILIDLGVPQELLDRSQTIEKDPGLEPPASQIAGSVFAPGDESGDCHIFANRLADKCIEKGAKFRFSLRLRLTTSPTTSPLAFTKGPPLFPGEAGEEKRMKFQAPLTSSGVKEATCPPR